MSSILQNKKILIVVALFFLLPSGIALAEVSDTYVPLSTIPDTSSGGPFTVSLEDPGGYFANLLTLFISIASMLGVIKLMLCGFRYMTSEAISTKEEAKVCIWWVLGGLFLILLSVLILQTINEDLIQIPFESIKEGINEGTPGSTTFSPSNLGVHWCYVNDSGQKFEFSSEKSCTDTLKAARVGSPVGLSSSSCTKANCAYAPENPFDESADNTVPDVIF